MLRYLARSVAGVALSNARLVSLADGRGTFRYHDYADGRRRKALTLAADEFLRRFLVHVLPCHFVKVRHYGLLANRHCQAKLAVCRRVLLVVGVAAALAGTAVAAAAPRTCPNCGGEVWVVVARVARPRVAEVCRLPLTPDSS